ncbi:MAG: ribosome maturation factor RimM [Desulfohalobiaceae bacterium]|nr:ribosome maturation factor RimM [Desulfohalobiaceae bacterium]
MDKSNFVIVGAVSKPHGLKGEICVKSYTDSPFLFQELKRIYLRLPDRFPKRYTVESVRFNRDRPLLSLQEIRGRDQARDLAGAEVLIRRKDLPEQDANEVMIADLVGLEVFRPDGRSLGSIQEVQVHSGQEIWVISGAKGEEILLPAVDQFVLEIDVRAGRAVVEPPPGLIELYTNP